MQLFKGANRFFHCGRPGLRLSTILACLRAAPVSHGTDNAMVIMEIVPPMNTRRAPNAATTLVEVLIAVVLVAVFFASVFELNAVCLRYIEASKEAVAGIAAVQDRTEVIRNVAFADLTNATYMQTLLATPANGSDLAKRATEVVKIKAYPTANGVTQFTRNNGTVTKDSTATSLGDNLVQVDVSLNWPATFGRRSRTEQTTMILSNGQKK
jgi:Tfp pilus assembly protein PilV